MGRIANDNAGETAKPADDDAIQPFQLEVSGLRGRVVRLGPVLNQILSAHDYPLPVAQLLAETAATALILSSMLKYEGIFTLQTSSDGPIRSLVADVTSAGDLRAYAAFDPEALAQAAMAAQATGAGGEYDGLTLRQLVGQGYLAFTVDQGPQVERYQGIVGLDGDTLTHGIQHYFDQSEQIGTTLKVGARLRDTGWRAGGIMLQRMPEAGEAVRGEGVVPLNPTLIAEKQEDWARAQVLLQSCSVGELTNADLHSHDVLFRLFHEEGVRVYEPQSITRGCRCTPQKLQAVLTTLSDDDRAHATKDGHIEMTCAFCSKAFCFDAMDLTPKDSVQ